MTYTEFKKLKINTSSIGWEPAGKNEAYFCTPVGARIIGRAGVDGIHYCTVRRLGETIFSVSPMNLPGQYVRPIAKNFDDLLRLLLACLNLNIIEQAWMWDEEQLAEQIGQVRNSKYFDPAPLDAIREKCGLEPMENPYEYLYHLCQAYNYAQIPFTDEYYQMMAENTEWQPPAEWKVTMDGDFTPVRGKGGREITVNQTFSWGNETWFVPAVYLCRDGIVADFLARIDSDSDEPAAAAHFTPTLTVNGAELKVRRGRWESWNCGDYADREPVAEWILGHYGADLTKRWSIRRCTFPSDTQIEEITSLSLHLERGRKEFPGIRIPSPKVGDEFTFRHPTAGTEHTLTVTEYEPYDTDYPADDDWLYPTKGLLMRYTVAPEIPLEEMDVHDMNGGDSPRRNPASAERAGNEFCSVIGVIRSSDGPSVVTAASGSTVQLRSACSGLHFETPENVTWCVQFRIRTVEDKEITLIG